MFRPSAVHAPQEKEKVVLALESRVDTQECSDCLPDRKSFRRQYMSLPQCERDLTNNRAKFEVELELPRNREFIQGEL